MSPGISRTQPPTPPPGGRAVLHRQRTQQEVSSRLSTATFWAGTLRAEVLTWGPSQPHSRKTQGSATIPSQKPSQALRKARASRQEAAGRTPGRCVTFFSGLITSAWESELYLCLAQQALSPGRRILIFLRWQLLAWDRNVLILRAPPVPPGCKSLDLRWSISEYGDGDWTDGMSGHP